MAVLVTGGAGYIGSHMVWALLDAGEEVVVVDRLSTGSRWAVAKAARFYLGDAADRALLDQIFEENQIETIFHFAGSVSVPESISQPLEYYENNTGTTRALVAAAVAHGIRNFIFSSTAAVYGNQPFDGPVPETACCIRSGFAPTPSESGVFAPIHPDRSLPHGAAVRRGTGIYPIQSCFCGKWGMDSLIHPKLPLFTPIYS